MASPVHHPDIEQEAGDDWTIVGTLTDANNAPLDLSSAILEWTLIDSSGNLAIPMNSAQIVIVPPAADGIININVSNAVTVNLAPGRYTDALRVTIADLKDTLWVGIILVDADLFSIGQSF